MKASSFSRLLLVFGLAVGIMVLWAAAAPSTTGTDSFIGGWTLRYCPGPCTFTDWEPCEWGPTGEEGCDEDKDTAGCVGRTGPGWCTPQEVDVCDEGGDTCPGTEGECL